LANGNVGIGTNNPAAMLDVNGAANVRGGLTVGGSGLNGNGAGLTNLNASKLSSGTVPASVLSTNLALRTGGNTFSGSQIVNGPGGGTAMAVTGGNVGIGTTTPSAPLDVNGPGGGTAMIVVGGNVGIGTISPTAALDVNVPGGTAMIVTGGNVGIGTTTPSAPLDVNGPGGGPAMIVTGGNVGIGTSNPDEPLSVNGNADKPGGGFWDTFSDGRLKDVGESFTQGLEALEQLQPVHYHYQSDNPLNLPSKPEYVGVVAQEVQKVVPEAVERNKDGYLLVNNEPIFWAMLNAIKQLKSENDQLKQRLANLEKQAAVSPPREGAR
jgi:hypothetical protein